MKEFYLKLLLYIKFLETLIKKYLLNKKMFLLIDQHRPRLPAVLEEGIPELI